VSKDLRIQVQSILQTTLTRKIASMPDTRTETELRRRIADLQQQVAELEAALQERPHSGASLPSQASHSDREAELRSTLYSIGDAVIATDRSGRITRMNPVAERLTGWREAEAVDQPLDSIFRIINEQSRRQVESPVTLVLREGTVVGLANHTLLINRDGREIPIADSGSPILDSHGQIRGVVLVFRDQTEERLHQYIVETRLALFEYAADHTLDQLLERALAEVAGSLQSPSAAFRLIRSDSQQAAPEQWNYRQTDQPQSNGPVWNWATCLEMKQVLLQNGQTGPRRELIIPVLREGRTVALLGLAHKSSDYSERDSEVGSFFADVIWEIARQKRTEEAVRYESERARRYFELAEVLFVALDVAGTVTSVNRKTCRSLGYAPEQIIGKNWFTEFVPAPTRSQVQAVFDMLIAGAIEPVEYFENAVTTGAGAELLIAWHNTILRDDTGAIIGVLSAGEDVSEHRKAVAALQASEERYRGVVEDSPGLICCYSPDGTITFVNRAYCEYFNKTPNQLIGASFLPLIPEAERERVMANHAGLTPAGPTLTHEHRVIAPDGTIRWQRWINRALFDEHGKIVSYQSIGEDVTERKETEAALQASEEKYRLLVENAGEAITAVALDDRLIVLNNAAARLVGETPDKLIGKRLYDLLPPEDAALHLASIRNVIETGQGHTVEVDVPVRNSRVWLQTSTQPVRDEQGNITAVLSISTDISERRRAETALRESEARYRAIAANFPNGMIALYGHDLRYTLVDGQGLAQIGLSSTDLEGKRLRDVFPPTVYERDEPALLAALQGETVEVVVPFGDQFFRVTTLPVKDEYGEIFSGMVMSQNITELKRAELTLKNTLEQLQLAIDTAKLGIWRLDPATEHMEWNDQQIEIYGINREEFAANLDGWRTQIHPEDRQFAEHRLTEAFEGRNVFDVEFRIMRPNGEIRYINASASPLYDTENQMIELIGINIDVTRMKQHEAALRDSEEKYRLLAEMTQDIIFLHDIEGRITYMNRAGLKATGLDWSTAIGKPVRELIPIEYSPAIDKHKLRRDTGDEQTYRYEIEILHQAGTHIPVEVISTPILRDKRISEIMIVARDITERRQAEAERARLEDQIHQAQKLESIGRLAGGVAHDFNNMLSVILGRTEIAVLQMSPNDPLFTTLDEIRRAAERSTDLTRQLLAFARKQTISPKVLDFNETIEGMLKYAPAAHRRGYRPGLAARTRVRVRSRVDPCQVDQILANLCINARDAIAKECGKVTIETDTADVRRGYSRRVMPRRCSR
jgi:two-component system cell cycle sensor histidine kinase/response regulator CckA